MGLEESKCSRRGVGVLREDLPWSISHRSGAGFVSCEMAIEQRRLPTVALMFLSAKIPIPPFCVSGDNAETVQIDLRDNAKVPNRERRGCSVDGKSCAFCWVSLQVPTPCVSCSDPPHKQL